MILLNRGLPYCHVRMTRYCHQARCYRPGVARRSVASFSNGSVMDVAIWARFVNSMNHRRAFVFSMRFCFYFTSYRPLQFLPSLRMGGPSPVASHGYGAVPVCLLRSSAQVQRAWLMGLPHPNPLPAGEGAGGVRTGTMVYTAALHGKEEPPIPWKEMKTMDPRERFALDSPVSDRQESI